VEETVLRLQFGDPYSVEDYLWANLEAYQEILTELAAGPLFTL
jgi:hypothetical protein